LLATTTILSQGGLVDIRPPGDLVGLHALERVQARGGGYGRCVPHDRGDLHRHYEVRIGRDLLDDSTVTISYDLPDSTPWTPKPTVAAIRSNATLQ
jgi:hypothetical protein